MNLKKKKELMGVFKGVIYHLTNLYKHTVHYNELAPFPVYDTEYVSNIKKKIEEMKALKEECDKLPVYFCTHCKSLHIEVDEKQNNICHRCGSVNEVAKLPNIEAYNKKYGNIWE